MRSAFAWAGFVWFAGLASAGAVTFTSSSAFELATNVNITETYGGFTNGEDLSSGFSADGITYSAVELTDGATVLDITNLYNSVSGLSLGVDHTGISSGDTYFFATEGATLTFSSPISAFGMFFNVNLNSGSYGFTTSAGSATTGSASDDTSTFVFAGIVSTTPFTSVTFSSTGDVASYNVAELLATSAVPEPTTFGLGIAGGLLFMARKFVRR